MSRFFRTLTHFADKPYLPLLAASCLMCLLSACSGNAAIQRQQYDFGLPAIPAVGNGSSKLQVSLADIQVVPALDSNAMWYRLQYDNAQQLKAYAQARWSMPPAQLLAQRLKIQMLATGTQVINANDGIVTQPVLRIELDEFSQVFTSSTNSHAQINARAVLSKGKMILAQRSFSVQSPSKTPDASGGARAMQETSDALISEIQQWLTQLAAV
ncbi:membrane integrity-associated transporter subunit PqiC [Undibacterium jejuense]|uniref:Membrane integrity-associated transporter subunit PqiC n=1 Tax=Undibacterium jejuense TaxID=1344949 RepID=A0A923HSL9_9BURK|nr:ABC-type transport auxiliary lipoprotein family protein [Undibacterium jejuense]MBC3863978.1 membrane integrity-associated transporter subunit PqiC [Undibacterium jejuense]